jgi:hypothetical protein
MRIITSILFLVSQVGSAWAGNFPGGGPPVIGGAPGPVMGAGIVGMTLAGSVLYLIKRRKRS